MTSGTHLQYSGNSLPTTPSRVCALTDPTKVVLIFVFCFIFWLLPLIATAQTKQPKPSANRYFDVQQYYRAAPLYEAQYARDTTDIRAAFYLAESYRHLFQYQAALTYYQRVYEQAPERFPASGFYYALMLKHQQQCDAALPVLARFIQQYPTSELHQRALVEQQGCYALQLSADSISITLLPLPSPVNTPFQEYAPVIVQHDSALMVTTTRLRGAQAAVNGRSGGGFARQRLFEQQAKGWKSDPTYQLKKRNTFRSEGAGYFDAARQDYYSTRCGEEHCTIMFTHYASGRWSKPQALSEAVNVLGANTKHPALSKGGDTLFFVSDRPGGLGGTDLWMSLRKEGQWSAAVNLGPEINTAYDEISPFYHDQEKLLFFASDGRGGVGGMDLYAAQWGSDTKGALEKSWVQMLPYPFNTGTDDCFLTLGRTQGYLASNRAGNFDIYAFAHDTTSFGDQLFGASPTISNNASLASGKSFIYDVPLSLPTDDRLVVRSAEQEQLANGATRFVLSSDVGDIALRERKRAAWSEKRTLENTFSSIPSFILPDGSPRIVTTISTDRVRDDQTAEAAGVLYETAQQEPVIKTKIHLLDQAGEVVKITTTNEQGAFRFLNLKPHAFYAVAVSQNVASNIAIQDLVIQAYGEEMKTISYETIYFDFNQTYIRPEGQAVLQELAQYYQRHPNIAIEINAYADSSGNDQYNYKLSQLRGAAVFEQLLQQGVNRSDVVINAQGVSTAVSSTHTLVSQQLNRRVELSIVGRDIRYRPATETRILKPNVALSQIAEETGVSVVTLRELNGLKKTILPFKPLRIPLVPDSVAAPLFYEIIRTQP